MQEVQLVIFDCDGVLIDSEPIASRTLSEILRGAGVDLSPADVLREFTGKAESDIRQLCAEHYGLVEVSSTFAAWHELLYATFKRELVPMEGMKDLVSTLTTRKCVASNSRSERLLASLGTTVLWPYFAPHVYGADSVARPKPAPDLLLHCAKTSGADPRATIMIDDSPHGVEAALAAGMTPIGFVDPGDPRSGREDVLRAAGASVVAVGAGYLAQTLQELSCEFRSPHSKAHDHEVA